MSRRRRMTGRARREQRRQARQRLGWIRRNPLVAGAGAAVRALAGRLSWIRRDPMLVAAGVATGALVGLALILAVFGSDGDGEPSTSALPSPTVPATVVVED